ncbi:hypothetical protein OHB26_01400 [Nocardia sp. NBC_01503]|uniref:hypothetical protein n=1 Tax=Nocardia sp. NBC_01503 TaxID=2975997 RepID=UPI002E7B42CA|nr:hypothetical protein [Nocardia sp. NBC_01503]WTL32943.1 hypothetical protein OHB26_01400 [Nocardia sp. NBC_01503]
MPTQTSATEVVQHFTSRGRIALRELQKWKQRPGCEHVPQAVLGHTTSAPYTIAADDIMRLETKHPLGQARPQNVNKIAAIRNWRPDFAFTHLFHFMLEQHHGVFSWEEFRMWAQGPDVREWLWEPAQKLVRDAIESGFDSDLAHQAMQWRIGNSYYSFLRELYVIARFRECGIPLLCHPLADALFRADAWCEGMILELYIPNPAYKTAYTGRKFKAADFFTDQEHLTVLSLELPVQRIFGEVHLPTDETINAAVARLRTAAGQRVT